MDTSQRKHIIAEKLGEKLSKAAGQSTSKYFTTICRVPQELRKLNESAYTPRLISIGPLHSKDDQHHLKQLEQNIKISYVSSLFYKTSCGSEEEDIERGMLKECLEDMENSIEDAKKCYAEEGHALNAEMLVMDGCFILELLHRDYDRKRGKPPGESIDPIFHFPLRLSHVKYDLLLLENQLPYFILEKLFSRTLGRISGHPSLRECVLSYFHKMLRIGFKCSSNNSNPTNCCLPNSCRPSDCVVSLDRRSQKPETYHHILHLLRDHYVRDHGEQKEKKAIGELKEMHSASDLDYAGIKFVARTGGEDLFDVEFNHPPLWCCRRGRFEIPSLRLDDSTEPFLRNLIAFEQCCPGVFPHITSYAFFMDRLVNTEKDVEVLEKAGVIRHYLGTRERVCDLFNCLCKEVSLNTRRNFYFAQTWNDAAEYSQRSWCSRAVPATTAYVIRTYSASPWTFIAFLVAFISFGIGVTNFILSFL